MVWNLEFWVLLFIADPICTEDTQSCVSAKASVEVLSKEEKISVIFTLKKKGRCLLRYLQSETVYAVVVYVYV